MYHRQLGTTVKRSNWKYAESSPLIRIGIIFIHFYRAGAEESAICG